jgi:hypothetical protein
MLSDQGGYPRPRGKPEQGLDETSADKRACSLALAAPLVTGVLNTGDQSRYFGGVEKCCHVADDRATRYGAYFLDLQD